MKKRMLLLFSAILITGGTVFAFSTEEEVGDELGGGADTCTPANCPGSGTNCCRNSAGSTIFKGKDQ